MNSTQLICLALAAILLAAALVVRLLRREPPPADGGAQDRLDTIIAWPPQPARVMSTAERVAFMTLTRALPGHMVLAQVPLSRFLKVPRRHSHSEWLRRIGNQSVDLLVCDMTSQVLAVVEVHSAKPNEDDRVHKRSRRIARILEAAGIKLHVWHEASLPSVEWARDAVLPKLPTTTADAPLAATADDAGAAPDTRLASNPFDEADRDASQDEFIELSEFNETPPSTWFDDLDSGPTPLQKLPRR